MTLRFQTSRHLSVQTLLLLSVPLMFSLHLLQPPPEEQPGLSSSETVLLRTAEY